MVVTPLRQKEDDVNCNAIYHENGQIELPYPIKLRRLPANIQVIIH
jgi:hypothetical protein